MTSQRRRPLVAGNWKMHRTGPEAVELIRELRDGLTDARAEVMVAPPFTALESASRSSHSAAPRTSKVRHVPIPTTGTSGPAAPRNAGHPPLRVSPGCAGGVGH